MRCRLALMLSGVIGWIEIPQRSSLRPYQGVLSFLSGSTGGTGSETPRVHHAARRRGSVAARGARAAAGDAGDRISQRHLYVEPRSRTGVGLDAVIHKRVIKISAENRKPASAIGAAGLSLAALGAVFADLGTSPLYTLKTVLNLTGPNPDSATTLGALSLILWTLLVVTTIKYVNFAMRFDNDGEGGIIALLALLGVKKQHRPAIVAAGLFGAALIYGDGTITPAISVLSA